MVQLLLCGTVLPIATFFYTILPLMKRADSIRLTDEASAHENDSIGIHNYNNHLPSQFSAQYYLLFLDGIICLRLTSFLCINVFVGAPDSALRGKTV